MTEPCPNCGVPMTTPSARSGPLQRMRQTVRVIRDRYPEDVFLPAGKSSDCAAARFARSICDEILAAETEDEDA